jgi:hypothetical protein
MITDRSRVFPGADWIMFAQYRISFIANPDCQWVRRNAELWSGELS